MSKLDGLYGLSNTVVYDDLIEMLTDLCHLKEDGWQIISSDVPNSQRIGFRASKGSYETLTRIHVRDVSKFFVDQPRDHELAFPAYRQRLAERLDRKVVEGLGARKEAARERKDNPPPTAWTHILSDDDF